MYKCISTSLRSAHYSALPHLAITCSSNTTYCGARREWVSGLWATSRWRLLSPLTTCSPPSSGREVRYFLCVSVHVLMRDEKEGRKKQARSNKQQGKAIQHTQGSHFSCYMFNERWEGRKKEASKVKQTTMQSNTAHPRQSLFQSCLITTVARLVYVAKLLQLLQRELKCFFPVNSVNIRFKQNFSSIFFVCKQAHVVHCK